MGYLVGSGLAGNGVLWCTEGSYELTFLGVWRGMAGDDLSRLWWANE